MYTQQKKVNFLFFSFLLLSIASILHAGVIFIVIGYFYYLLKEKSSSKIQFIKKPIIYILIIVLVFSMFSFDDIFLRKFSKIESVDSIVDQVAKGTNSSAGSAYLQGYEINSFRDLIFYSPLKFLYFFFSPVPWEIRNINDVIAFGLDVFIYFYLFYLIVKKVKNINWKNPSNQLFLCLLISIITTGFVYALGTSNAGTALRHRYKILILIILAVFVPVKSKLKKSKLKQNYKKVI